MQKYLPYNEAKKAIVIDFEGPGPSKKKLPLPLLLGACGPWTGSKRAYKAFFLKEQLAPIAKSRSLIGRPEITTLKKAIEQILDLAENQNLRVAYYSVHEETVIQQYAPGLLNRFLKCGFNAKISGKAMCNRQGIEKHEDEDYSLENVIRWLRIEGAITPVRPKRGVPETCKFIEKVAGTKKKWGQWTKAEKLLVSELLRYNKVDIKAARKVLSVSCYRAEHR